MPVGGYWNIDDYLYWLGMDWVSFRHQLLIPGRSKPSSLKLNGFLIVIVVTSWQWVGRKKTGMAATIKAAMFYV
jgi:hypothetical protein